MKWFNLVRSFAAVAVLAGAGSVAGCVAVHTGPPAKAAGGATAEQQALHADILRADSTMFAAYNAHDVDGVMALFTRDLEFYHDTGGLLTWAQVDAGSRSVFANSKDIHRELVGPVEVYPISNYGAIEVASHRFCHTENGKQDCGTFKFMHVWKKSAAGWQVARAVSYDH